MILTHRIALDSNNQQATYFARAAATNLEKLAASSAVTVCGGKGSGLWCKPKVKPATVKQEPNAVYPVG